MNKKMKFKKIIYFYFKDNKIFYKKMKAINFFYIKII